MAAQQEAIKTFMASLDNTTLKGAAALNDAVKTLSGGSVTTMQALINQMVADCKATGNATKFLQDYCGINLSNTDTGAITGSDAGYSTTAKTPESIVSEKNEALKAYTGDDFTLAGGLKISLAGGYASISDSTVDKNDVKQYIWSALKQWWVPGAFSLIALSYGDNYNVDSVAKNSLPDDGTTNVPINNTILVKFYSKQNNVLASAGFSYYDTTYKIGKKTYPTPANLKGIGWPTELNINTYYYGSVPSNNTDKQNGKSTSAGYLDRTLAHEFTHTVMENNIRYFYALPQFIKEGMAELTHGIDDERYSSILALAGNATKLNKALNMKNTGTGTADAYSGGYMFLRYLAKELQTPKYTTVTGGDYYSNYNNTSVVSALAGNDTVRNRVDKATIDGGAGNDYLINNKQFVSLFGGANNDTIESKVANVTLDGGANDDSIVAATKATIIAGAGNDTLTGSGSNVYMFGNADGENLITKFVPKTDVIYLTGITSADNVVLNTLQSSDDTNLVLTAGTTKITVPGAAIVGAKVRFNDGTKLVTKTLKSLVFGEGNDSYSNFKASAKLNALGGNDTVGNAGNKAIINGGDGNDNLWTTSITTAVTLNGGNGDDMLTTYGAKSMLIGGAGSDIFTVYDSKNTINGGADSDIIILDDNSAGNTIVYGNNDGFDVMGGFNGSDILQLSGVTNITTVETVEGYTDDKIHVMELKFGTKTTDSLGNTNYGTTVRIMDPGTVKVKLKNNKVYTLREQTTATGYSDFINNYESVGDSTFNLSTGNDTLNNYTADAVINGDADNDYLYSYKTATGSQLIGGYGNDSLYTQAENVKLDGGADNDYLNSTAANVTITGGTGNDTIALNAKTSKANVINYASGDGADIITGFSADDTLKITGADFATVKSGKDFIVKVGDDLITLKNTKTVNIDGTQRTAAPSGLYITSLPINKKVSVPYMRVSQSGLTGKVDLTYYPTIKYFNGNNSSGLTIQGNWNNDTIFGGAGADSISGFKGNNVLAGGAGDDTLIGSTGNDTLQGDAGNDTFVYSGGKDTVLDYSAGDRIYLGMSVSDFTYSIKNYDVTFKVGKNTLTVKNALANSNGITYITTDEVSEGNFTDVSHTVNGGYTSALIAEDDNFNNDVLLDEIIATPIVGDFETGTSNKDTLQGGITYGGGKDEVLLR